MIFVAIQLVLLVVGMAAMFVARAAYHRTRALRPCRDELIAHLAELVPQAEALARGELSSDYHDREWWRGYAASLADTIAGLRAWPRA